MVDATKSATLTMQIKLSLVHATPDTAYLLISRPALAVVVVYVIKTTAAAI